MSTEHESPDRAAVTNALASLSEHFENVVILVSKVNESGGTEFVTRNSGNNLANVCLAELFLENQEVSYESERSNPEGPEEDAPIQ